MPKFQYCGLNPLLIDICRVRKTREARISIHHLHICPYL